MVKTTNLKGKEGEIILMRCKLTVPDANKPSIKISGLKLNKIPFKTIGSVILKAERKGFRSFQVIETSFDEFFPENESFWNMTDMFCNSCNSNIHSYTWNSIKPDYEKILFNGTWMVWSKHKLDSEHWKVILYDKKDDILLEQVKRYLIEIESNRDTYEFEVV